MQLKSEMKNCKNKRMYIRYSVILKHFQGLTNKDIAKLENLEEHTVGRYIKNYKTPKGDSVKFAMKKYL